MIKKIVIVSLISSLFYCSSYDDTISTINKYFESHKYELDGIIPVIKKIDDIENVLPKIVHDNTQDCRIRGVAHYLIAKLKIPNAREILERSLLEDQDVRNREAAADSLGVLGDPKSITALKKACEDTDKEGFVRGCALLALAKLGNRESLKEGLKMLNDSHPTNNLLGCEIIEELGDETVLNEIEIISKSPKNWNKAYTERAICAIKVKTCQMEKQEEMLLNIIKNSKYDEVTEWATIKLLKKNKKNASKIEKIENAMSNNLIQIWIKESKENK